MEEEAKDLIVLGAIRRGNKKFEKIQKATKIDPKGLNGILEKLDKRGFIKAQEKKGWLGTSVQIDTTEKGNKETDERVHELQSRWSQMSAIYKTGDKGRLKQYMDENKSYLPTMMFFGIMDMVMFSMMFSMMGLLVSDFVPAQDLPAGMEDAGMEGADDGGFDIDIGF